MLFSLVLPVITRFIIEITQTRMSEAAADMVARFGNIILVVLFFIGIFAIIFGIISAIMKYAGISYELGEYSLKLKHGIISNFEISIPFKNIQDIDLNQSIFYRLIGVAKLRVLSGGEDEKGQGNEVVFEVIDYGKAEELRMILTQKSEIQQVKQI